MNYENSKKKNRQTFEKVFKNDKNLIDLVNKRDSVLKYKLSLCQFNHKKIHYQEYTGNYTFDMYYPTGYTEWTSTGIYYAQWRISFPDTPLNFLPYIRHSIIVSYPKVLTITPWAESKFFERQNDTEIGFDLILSHLITEAYTTPENLVLEEFIPYEGASSQERYIKFSPITYKLKIVIYNPFEFT